MNWWIFALLSGAGLATRNVAFKLANLKIDAALGALTLSLSMAAASLLWFAWQRLTTAQPLWPQDDVNTAGLALAVLSGIGVAVANIFLAFAYKQGGPASLVAILQNGMAISLTILIGTLLMGETVRPLQIAGIFAAVTGILLIVKG